MKLYYYVYTPKRGVVITEKEFGSSLTSKDCPLLLDYVSKGAIAYEMFSENDGRANEFLEQIKKLKENRISEMKRNLEKAESDYKLFTKQYQESLNCRY